MRTKHLCVLINIRVKGEVDTVKHLYMFKPSSNFLGGASSVDTFCYLFWSLPYCLVFLLQHCVHLLGKDWPLGSLVCDVFLCFLSLSDTESWARCGT